MTIYLFRLCLLLMLAATPLAIASAALVAEAVHSDDHVVSMDVKYVDDVVHLLLVKRINDTDSVWYQTSADQGQSWSEPVSVTQGHIISAAVSRGNDARLAVQGDHLVAVWRSKKMGVKRNAGPMVAMASSDAGQTWQRIASPADWTVGSHGFFAMDANQDEMSLVWLDSRTTKGDGATQGLRYAKSTDGGQTWSANVTLDERSCACCWNTAQYFGDDFYVLYRDKDPSDMTLGKINPEQQWQALSTVGQFDWDFKGCPHIGGSLAYDSQRGVLHSTVGTGHPDKTGSYYLRSNDMGQTWQAPVALGGELSVHTDMAVSEQGDVLAAWDHITETGFQIAMSTLAVDGQTWSTPVGLSESTQRATHPRVVALGNGFLVLWTEGEAKKPSRLRVVKVP